MKSVLAFLVAMVWTMAAYGQASPTYQSLTVLGTTTLGGNLAMPSWSQTSSADAALNITTGSNNSFNLTVTDHSSAFIGYPMSLYWINQNPGFTGPYEGNYQQYSPLAVEGISSPTSTGNTSAANFGVRSYGNNPSSAYDVDINNQCLKYGQNSNWCYVANLNDFSGRPVQAFGNWNEELDIIANGPDPVQWDSSYAMPHAGGRVGEYLNFSNLDLSGISIAAGGWAWAANTAIKAMGVNKADYFGAQVLKVYNSFIPYLWYCVTGGTTGGTEPAFPIPAEFVGAIASGTLTVTNWQSTSSPIAVGNYLTWQGANADGTVLVVALGTGTGGNGTYTVTGAPTTLSAVGMYGAPHITDGTAVWAFGENFQEIVSAGIWFTGTGAIGTVIGGSNTITNAVLDTTQFPISSGGAAIRLAHDQIIDLTGAGTTASQNQHTLRWSSATGPTGGLAYTNPDGTVFDIQDSNDMMEAQGITSLAWGAKGNVNGIVTGYRPAGLTVGWNFDGGAETNLMTNANGFSVHTISAGGVPSTSPYFQMNGSGVVTTNLGLTTFSQSSSADQGLNLSSTAYALNLSTTAVTSTGFGAYPLNLQYTNNDPNFTSPSGGNYQQYAPLKARGLISPVGTGNVSAAQFEVDDYSQNPSESYNYPVNLIGAKYGQSSMWGQVNFLIDKTGRPPQNIAAWNIEQDIEADGADFTPWDPNYYKAIAGSRVFNFHSLITLPQPAWTANTAVGPLGGTGDQYVGANVIQATVSGTPYLWYCVTAGTTGSTQPTWTAPVEFTATIASGVMTVSSVTQGTLAVGQYITNQNFIVPVQITSLGTGTGGVGTYNLSNSSVSVANSTGMYAAPQVADGTAVWAFGENAAMSVSVGDWWGGSNTSTSLNTVIGGTTSVSGGVLDCSQFNLYSSNSACLRVGSGQKIDLTGNGTQAGNNQHTISYTSSALQYTVAGSAALTITDTGAMSVFGTLGNTGTAHLAGGTAANLYGVGSGYSSRGLTFGYNLNNGNEADLLVGSVGGTDGLRIYGIGGGGFLTSSTPLSDLDLNGDLALSGTLTYVGHQINTQVTAPTVAQSGGTGSTTLDSGATDTKGTATEGTAATGFVVTFHTAYATAPDCVVTSPTGSALTSYTPATGTLTVVNAALTGAKFTYVCIQ
jgi:hypothetical protein